MSPKSPVITTAAGVPVADNENALTAGPRGPLLIDYQLMERMAHFNRERVPERVVHTYHRDGQTRFDGNYGGTPNYEPNSFGGPVGDPRFKEPPLTISGRPP